MGIGDRRWLEGCAPVDLCTGDLPLTAHVQNCIELWRPEQHNSATALAVSRPRRVLRAPKPSRHQNVEAMDPKPHNSPPMLYGQGGALIEPRRPFPPGLLPGHGIVPQPVSTTTVGGRRWLEIRHMSVGWRLTTYQTQANAFVPRGLVTRNREDEKDQ